MMTLNEKEVHLWEMNYSDFMITPHDGECMSEDEKQKYLRKKIPELREQYLKTRIFLRKTLSSYLDIPPEKIEFSFTEQNKPFILNNNKNIFFNLSHTKTKVVCAVVRGSAIGIDLESIHRESILDIAKNYFHEAERLHLQQLSEVKQKNDFFVIWTRKEAILKALGIGLSFPMRSFSVLPLSDIRLNVSGHDLYLRTLMLDEENVVSVSAAQSLENISLLTHS